MKVLLACLDSPATQQGGVEWYTHHLAHALAREGHDVTVMARQPRTVPSALVEDVRYEWAPLPTTDGPTTHRYRLLWEPRFWRHVGRRAQDFDLVHSQNMDAMGALGKRPVVSTVHTTALDEWESSRLGGWREALYQRHLQALRVRQWRRFVAGASHLWCVADHVAQSLRELGAREVEVLPNPVPRPQRTPQPEARRALGLPQEAPLALYVGRLARVKRVDRLVETLAKLPEWHAVIAGEGPEREALERQAAPLGARVRFAGRVDDAQKALLLSAADAFCLPSEHEGQPLAILEAMAAGVPVVATRPEWVPSALREYGRWGDDYAALLEEARRAGRHGGAPVATYEQTARRVAQVYEEVARR